ncbi:hypothetical protein GOV14_00460 [Candidatus Pacearchaeota archaeon]|nr:hypothetical protein [Candidatus Pacearchaeota archaeon]
MRLKREFTVLVLLALLVFGVGLMGLGITGLVVKDETVGVLCLNDSECEGIGVCCPFYDESMGVCHVKEMCESILEVTQEGDLNDLEFSSYKGLPRTDDVFTTLTLGLLITLVSGLILYYLYNLRPIKIYKKYYEKLKRSKKSSKNHKKK